MSLLMYCQTNAFKTFNVGGPTKISNSKKIVISWLMKISVNVNICGLFFDEKFIVIVYDVFGYCAEQSSYGEQNENPHILDDHI